MLFTFTKEIPVDIQITPWTMLADTDDEHIAINGSNAASRGAPVRFALALNLYRRAHR